jgi:hypothetical protein
MGLDPPLKRLTGHWARRRKPFAETGPPSRTRGQGATTCRTAIRLAVLRQAPHPGCREGIVHGRHARFCQSRFFLTALFWRRGVSKSASPAVLTARCPGRWRGARTSRRCIGRAKARLAAVIETASNRQAWNESRIGLAGSRASLARASTSLARRSASSAPSSQPRAIAVSISLKPPWRSWASSSQSKGSLGPVGSVGPFPPVLSGLSAPPGRSPGPVGSKHRRPLPAFRRASWRAAGVARRSGSPRSRRGGRRSARSRNRPRRCNERCNERKGST